MILGDPNTMPTIKGASNFNGGYLIDGDPYFTSSLNWGSTNVFFRQIRNLQFDTRSIPAGNSVSGIVSPYNMLVSDQYSNLFSTGQLRKQPAFRI